MAREKVTDADVIAAVAALRAQEGSVTVRSLAARIGLSTSGTAKRVDALIGSGRLERGEDAGSLRLAEAKGQVLEIPLILEVDPATHQPLAVRLA